MAARDDELLGSLTMLFGKQSAPPTSTTTTSFLPFQFYLHPKDAWRKLKTILDTHIDKHKHTGPTGWDLLRRHTYKKANYRCQVCGGHGDEWPVAAADEWAFSVSSRTQTYTGMIALCPPCNQARYAAWKVWTHPERVKDVILHLTKVTSQPELGVRHMAREAIRAYKPLLGVLDWKLDLSQLRASNILPRQYLEDVEKSLIAASSQPPRFRSPHPSPQGQPFQSVQPAGLGFSRLKRNTSNEDDDCIPEDVNWEELEES